MERVVHPGEFYRHFKNKLYQIITVATHSETGEPMVVYQALYGDFRTYVRPLEMFLSEVDHGKYPNVGQRYRFEQVSFPDAGEVGFESLGVAALSLQEERGMETPAEPEAAVPQSPHPGLLRFLEAVTYEERMACLKELEKTAGQTELDSIYLVLDMKPQAGTISEQLGGIRRYLNMQKHYDGGHLR